MKLECNLWHFNFYNKTYEFVKRIKEKGLFIQHIFIVHNCIIRFICTTHFLLTITSLFGFLVPIFCLGTEEVSINYYKISTFGFDYL